MKPVAMNVVSECFCAVARQSLEIAVEALTAAPADTAGAAATTVAKLVADERFGLVPSATRAASVALKLRW